MQPRSSDEEGDGEIEAEALGTTQCCQSGLPPSTAKRSALLVYEAVVVQILASRVGVEVLGQPPRLDLDEEGGEQEVNSKPVEP